MQEFSEGHGCSWPLPGYMRSSLHCRHSAGEKEKKTHRQLYANFSYHGSLMKASCFHEIIMWKRKPPCHRLHHLLDELRFSDLILLMGKRNIKQILYVEKNELLLNMCLYVNVNAHVTEVHRIYLCVPYLNEEWATFIVYAIEELCSEIYFLLYESFCKISFSYG